MTPKADKPSCAVSVDAPLSDEDLAELDRLRDSHPRLWQFIMDASRSIIRYRQEIEPILTRLGAKHGRG